MVELGTLIHQAKIVRCGEGDYPILSMTMHDGLVFQNDKFNKTIASKDRSDYKIVNRNQLVISFPIDEGVLAAQRIVDAGIVSPAYGIWDINQEMILPEFLEYALRCNRALSYYKAKLRGSTARRRSLPTPTLLAYTVPLPDISEQEHILNVVHKTQKVISDRTEEISLLDNLIKARFVEMFGDPEINSFDWPVCTLKELVSIEPQNGLYKPQSAYVQDGSGFPIVRIDVFYNGRITNFSTLKRLECSESEVQRYLLQENDIVINRVNSIEYLGKCAHIKGLLEETVFESNMMRLHLDDTVMNAVFATKLLCSQYIYKQIMIRAKKSVNQASINQQDVLSFRMFVPPLELQEQFAAFVEQTDKSKVVVQKALSKNAQYFTI